MLEEDPDVVAWWGSQIECASAIARLHRDGVLTAEEEEAARNGLAEFRQSWFEVQPGESLREQALRLRPAHIAFGRNGGQEIEAQLRAKCTRGSRKNGRKTLCSIWLRLNGNPPTSRRFRSKDERRGSKRG